MRKFGTISTRIWNDEKFVKLTDIQQLLFLYILTCPHGNLIGLFILKKGYITEDVKAHPKDIEKAFDAFVRAGLIEYDEELHLLWVRNFLKHNRLTSPNQFKAVPKIIAELPKSFLIRRFVEYNETALRGVLKAIELPSEIHRNTETETGTETGTESETGEEKRGLLRGGPSGPPSSPAGSDEPSSSGNNGNGKKEKPLCPYSKIIDLYHSILPGLPPVNVIGKTTRANIKNRWSEDPARWSLEFWEGFFKRVSESDFLMGRSKDWRVTFDWLFVAGNFGKILNGAYGNHKGSRLPERTRNNLEAAEAAKRMIEEGRL